MAARTVLGSAATCLCLLICLHTAAAFRLPAGATGLLAACVAKRRRPRPFRSARLALRRALLLRAHPSAGLTRLGPPRACSGRSFGAGITSGERPLRASALAGITSGEQPLMASAHRMLCQRPARCPASHGFCARGCAVACIVCGLARTHTHALSAMCMHLRECLRASACMRCVDVRGCAGGRAGAHVLLL